VVSVTRLQGSEGYCVIPDQVVMGGTVRTFRPEVQDTVEPAMRRIAEGVCQALGASAELRYERRYPATVNAPKNSELAAQAAADVVGEANVVHNPTPCMGAEDFAFMLQKRPGSYIWVGGGGDAMLHNPGYDFNDEILPIGASYWATLTEQLLA